MPLFAKKYGNHELVWKNVLRNKSLDMSLNDLANLAFMLNYPFIVDIFGDIIHVEQGKTTSVDGRTGKVKILKDTKLTLNHTQFKISDVK